MELSGARRSLYRRTEPTLYPSFFLQLSDAGSGAVITTPDIGNGSATFTRATTAWAKLSTGLWTSVASGTARSHYLGMDTTVGAYGGYLAEGARTNSCLQARDFSNASWTKSNVTAAKDQVGIDGVTNSASSLVATLANGTVTQAITLASAAKTYSVFIKRITGTGTIQISLDNFATNTDVTASINSSTYTQVAKTQTLANPTVGIKIVTSGDKISVDVAQLEDGASFASTPIPTTTVAVTRNADVLTYPQAGNISTSTGTIYAELFTLWAISTGITAFVATLQDGSGRLLFENASTSSAQISVFDGTTNLSKAGLTNMSAAIQKRASSWGGSGLSITGDGASTSTGLFDGTMGAGGTTNIGIGGGTSSGNEWYGTIKNVRIWTYQLPDAVLMRLTGA